MKRRQPNTFEHALMQIAACLGADGAGAVIGKSAARIHAASDPDRDNYSPLSAPQCLALDLAFNAECGGGWPIFEAYGAQLRACEAAKPVPPASRMAAIAQATALAKAAFAEAHCPDGPGGERVTNAEAYEIERAAAAAIAAINAMVEDAKRCATRGGSGAANTVESSSYAA